MSTRRLRPLPSRPRVTHSRPRPPPGAPPPRADRLHVPFATIHLSMFLVPTCHPTFGGLIDTNEDRKGRVRMARLRVRPLPSPQGVQTRGSRLWSCPPRQSVQTAAVGTTRPRTGFIHSCAKMVRGGACPPSGVPSSRDWPRPGRRGVGNRPASCRRATACMFSAPRSKALSGGVRAPLSGSQPVPRARGAPCSPRLSGRGAAPLQAARAAPAEAAYGRCGWEWAAVTAPSAA